MLPATEIHLVGQAGPPLGTECHPDPFARLPRQGEKSDFQVCRSSWCSEFVVGFHSGGFTPFLTRLGPDKPAGAAAMERTITDNSQCVRECEGNETSAVLEYKGPDDSQ